MKTAATRILQSGFTMLLLGCAQVSPERIAKPTNPPDDAKLVFSSLEADQTNRGTISIDG